MLAASHFFKWFCGQPDSHFTPPHDRVSDTTMLYFVRARVSKNSPAGSPRNSPEIMDALSHHFCTVFHILHRFVRVCFWRICTFGSSWHSHFSSSGSSHSHFSAFGCCHSHFSLLWSQAGYLVLKPRKGKVFSKMWSMSCLFRRGNIFWMWKKARKMTLSDDEEVATSKNCLKPFSSEAPTTIPACTQWEVQLSSLPPKYWYK